MATPTVTARSNPTGYKLPEGFKITLASSKKPALNIWEVEGAPAGLEVPEINTTTQFNLRYVSKWPSALIMNDDIAGSAGYDPDVMDDLIGLIGDVGGAWTVRMPDNTQHSYWAFLKSWKWGPLRVGQFPNGSYSICVTNWDVTTKTENGCLTTQAVGT